MLPSRHHAQRSLTALSEQLRNNLTTEFSFFLNLRIYANDADRLTVLMVPVNNVHYLKKCERFLCRPRRARLVSDGGLWRLLQRAVCGELAGRRGTQRRLQRWELPVAAAAFILRSNCSSQREIPELRHTMNIVLTRITPQGIPSSAQSKPYTASF